MAGQEIKIIFLFVFDNKAHTLILHLIRYTGSTCVCQLKDFIVNKSQYQVSLHGGVHIMYVLSSFVAVLMSLYE